MTDERTPAIELSPQLRERCRYPRLRGDTGVVLMVDAGYFIQRECFRAFQQCGWRTVPVPLAPPDQFIERLLTAAVFHRPDILFTVNHLGFDQEGALTRLLTSVELPCVSWFVDSPAYILLDHHLNASPLVMTPVWEREYERFLMGFGFDNVFHLPLAGDPEVFLRSGRDGDVQYRVGFVGDSMVAAVDKWRRLCRPFPGIERLIAGAAEKLLQHRHRDPISLARDTSQEMNIPLPDWTPEETLVFSSVLVLEATLIYRQRATAALSETELDLFGDQGWRGYMPPDAQLHRPVDYYSELPELYHSTAVNLNLTSLQMPTAVNQRVFDVPLAGGFLLTDRQDDLELLFDAPSETATFTDPEELPELVSYYLSHETRRLQIARRAASRVCAEHTYRHRIDTIIGQARRAFGAEGARTGIADLPNNSVGARSLLLSLRKQG